MCEEDGYMSDPDIFGEDCGSGTSAYTPPERLRPSCAMTALRGLMNGLPPPPERTDPRLDVPTMLDRWANNRHLQWTVASEGCLRQKADSRKKFNLITNRGFDASNSEVDSAERENLNVEEKFDIYLNMDSEEEEVLRLKVAERLISNETASSFVHQVILTNSARKRQRRNGWAKSPGSRLSYLAKRRATFSQRPGLANSRTIQIPKDDGKGTAEKKTVGLKRALFQSPDKTGCSTPEYSRSKRAKVCYGMSSQMRDLGRQPAVSRNSVSRNLAATFNQDNLRQKSYQRKPLASLPST